jgi:hypothetical protein
MNDEQMIWEAYIKNFKEIEFVCVNSEYSESTDINKQEQLYHDLKKIEGIYPLLQDWSDENQTQISMSAIILKNNTNLINQIKKLAEQHGVEIDMINTVSGDYVNRAIKGEHTGQITK